MKKLRISLIAVLLVFCVVSFAPAQESDAVFDNPSGDMKWTPTGLPFQLFIPHYTVIAGWWSGLCIHSMSFVANQYKVVYCNNNGYITGTKDGSLTAFEKDAWILTFGGFEGTGSNEGWIVVESQEPLLGFINYGQTGISVTTLGPFYSQ